MFARMTGKNRHFRDLSQQVLSGVVAKQGQGFKSSMAHLYPNIGQVPPALGSSHIIFTTH